MIDIFPNANGIIPYSNVYKAWRMVAATDTHPVKIAIIDGGFWLDSQGHPNLFNGGSDFPMSIPQYNFVDNNYFAGGAGVMDCDFFHSNGCWHGNGAASVALANLNDGFGVAGTGGLVAEPMLFKIDGKFDTWAKAVRTATSWGADIISISLGGGCDWYCEEVGGSFCGAGFGEGANLGCGEDLSEALDDAHSAGVLVIASSGNGENNNLVAHDVNEYNDFPCTHGHVLCVGALDDGLPRSIGYSNYGNKVEIYAPTNIHDLNIVNTATGLGTFGGTSASAPFVAGVAAMIKSVNPNLSGDQIKDILLRTAFTGLGSNIKYVNALGAVIDAAGGYRINPFIKITAPPSGFVVHQGSFANLFKASVMDPRDDDFPDSAIHWTSSLDSWFGGAAGHTAVPNIIFSWPTPEGPRTITATVTNPSDPSLRSQDSITLNLRYIHTPPSPIIITPQQNSNLGSGTLITAQGRATSTDPSSNIIPTMVPCDRMLWTTTNNANGQHEYQNKASTPGIDNAGSGTCNAQMQFNTPGTRTITLSTTNVLGDTGTSSVQVNVVNNPSFSFDLTSPLSSVILVGPVVASAVSHSDPLPVSITHLSGTSQPVSLDVIGLPVGVTASWQCVSGPTCSLPDYTKSLTFSTVPNNLPAPSLGHPYPITITATGGGMTKHLIVGLNVEYIR